MPETENRSNSTATVTGIVFMAMAALFLMSLVIASVLGSPVPNDSHFLICAILALCTSVGSGFLGGEAVAQGKLQVPRILQDPIRFGVTGGIAVFIIVLIISTKLYADVPSKGDTTMERLRSQTKAVHEKYEKLQNPNNPAKESLKADVLTEAPALAAEYTQVPDSELRSPSWLGIERDQRIAELKYFEAAIKIQDPERYDDVEAVANDIIKFASAGLEKGNTILKSNKNKSDRDTFISYYLSNPPNEQQILSWYRSAGLAIIARHTKTQTAIVAAKKEVSTAIENFRQNGDEDPSMDWVMEQK